MSESAADLPGNNLMGPEPERGNTTTTEPLQPSTDPLCILVVDDETLAVRELAAFLKRTGYVVLTAASGREARDHLLRHHIDILITDL